MDSFDFNIHQNALADLAASIANPSEESQSRDLAMQTIASRVQTRDLSGSDVDPTERVAQVSLSSRHRPARNRHVHPLLR